MENKKRIFEEIIKKIGFTKNIYGSYGLPLGEDELINIEFKEKVAIFTRLKYDEEYGSDIVDEQYSIKYDELLYDSERA